MFTTDSLQCVSTQPATVVMQYSRHAYHTHACDVFCSDTLYVHTDPDGYRALLKSAGSGTDHRIHITNLKASYALLLRRYIGFPESLCVQLLLLSPDESSS